MWNHSLLLLKDVCVADTHHRFGSLDGGGHDFVDSPSFSEQSPEGEGEADDEAQSADLAQKYCTN